MGNAKTILVAVKRKFKHASWAQYQSIRQGHASDYKWRSIRKIGDGVGRREIGSGADSLTPKLQPVDY